MRTTSSDRRTDAAILSRARRTLTLQLAGAVTLVVLVVGGLILVTTITGQRTDTARDLRFYVAHASVASPPPCVWMFTETGTTQARTPNAPASLPLRTDLDQVARDGGVRVTDVTLDGVDYTIRTQRRGDSIVQAAVDLRYQGEERQRLFLALIVAELGGLIAAVITGLLLARRAISPLEDALARQSRFVTDVSHELRTPLTRLHTRAQMLARESPPSDGVGTELTRIVADTRAFGEVIDDLLLSARLRQTDGGGGPADLARVADAVASADAARARSKGVTLGVTYDSTQAHVVTGVEAALRRVVGALVDNALEHVHPGGRVDLRLTHTDGGRIIEIAVADDGPGFDPADAERLFERFAQGRARSGSHVGLGLALVRDVVERHHGQISATSVPGAGATFTVRLPAAGAIGRPPRITAGLKHHVARG